MPHFLVAGDSSYFYPFTELGTVTNNAKDIETADVLVLTGGPDVDPSLYRHPRHAKTMLQPQRDRIDVTFIKEARKRAIPIVGICRGAQLLTVEAGGKLIQHCTDHLRSHQIVTADGETFKVSSSHHQMMDPHWGSGSKGMLQHKLLAWADNLADVKEARKDDPVIMYKEPEAVYYPDIKGLAVQWHPEWMSADTRGFTYFVELVEQYALK